MQLSANYRHVFTVFTPTFNRVCTLPRVYNSLRKQTFKDFEWLIVDDGSTDETTALIEKWKTEAPFPIRYFYQENQGKPAAFNRGVEHAYGELFLTLDSDDSCIPQALERFKHYWDSIPGDKKNFSAVTALCQDQYGKVIGDKFPQDVWDADSIELYFRHHLKGEKWGFQRTDVLKQFPFPTIQNTKFISEALVWFRIACIYKTRFVNEALRIYYLEPRRADRLSFLSPAVLFGRAVFHKYVLNEFANWFYSAPGELLRSAVNFSRYSFGLGNGARSQLKEVRPWLSRVLLAFALPLAFALSLKDKWRAEGAAMSAGGKPGVYAVPVKQHD